MNPSLKSPLLLKQFHWLIVLFFTQIAPFLVIPMITYKAIHSHYHKPNKEWTCYDLERISVTDHYTFTITANPKIALAHIVIIMSHKLAMCDWLCCRPLAVDSLAHTKDAYLSFFVGDWRTGRIKCRDYDDDDLGEALNAPSHTLSLDKLQRPTRARALYTGKRQAAVSLRAQCQHQWIDGLLVVTRSSRFTSDIIIEAANGHSAAVSNTQEVHTYECNRLYPILLVLKADSVKFL